MVTGLSRAPIHWMSRAAIALAAVAGVLALYGSTVAEKHIPNSLLRQARGDANVSAKPGPWYDRLITRGEVSVFGDRIDKKMLALTSESKAANVAVQFAAFVLPFFLGVGAALLGGEAMKAVQASAGRRRGNTLAVFSIMVGGLSAVTAGCMMVSLYLWPHLPSLYTT